MTPRSKTQNLLAAFSVFVLNEFTETIQLTHRYFIIDALLCSKLPLVRVLAETRPFGLSSLCTLPANLALCACLLLAGLASAKISTPLALLVWPSWDSPRSWSLLWKSTRSLLMVTSFLLPLWSALPTLLTTINTSVGNSTPLTLALAVAFVTPLMLALFLPPPLKRFVKSNPLANKFVIRPYLTPIQFLLIFLIVLKQCHLFVWRNVSSLKLLSAFNVGITSN